MDICECEIIDELDFRELEQIQQVMVKLTEGEVLEEFMLEEDIDFQERDNCKNVELSDKQEIEREMVVYEQEECVEMKICDVSLPKLFKATESVHANEIKLEMPKINEVEVRDFTKRNKVRNTHRTRKVKFTH